MAKYECPQEIYKYLSVNGLLKTLERQSIKFSRPSDFNDPLDMYLQETFGMDDTKFLEGFKEAFFQFLINDIDDKIIRSPVETIPLDSLILMRKLIKNAPQKEMQEFKNDLLSTSISDLYNLEGIKNTKKRVLSFISKSFTEDGVFCSTTDYNNMLMWAHYAEKHHGAVIQFTPDISKDSGLLASRKVRYSKARPLLYRSPDDMVTHAFTMTQEESIKKIIDELVYTKSVEWEYEKEYRLHVPKLIPTDQEYKLLEFYPQELTAVYLGCRMSDDVRKKVISTSKVINPLVRIYQAKISPREYSLDFEALQS